MHAPQLSLFKRPTSISLRFGKGRAQSERQKSSRCAFPRYYRRNFYPHYCRRCRRAGGCGRSCGSRALRFCRIIFCVFSPSLLRGRFYFCKNVALHSPRAFASKPCIKPSSAAVHISPPMIFPLKTKTFAKTSLFTSG